ncbi:MAG: YciI family protein [Devosia sp.]
MEGGEIKVHDGPYADTREQFGGYYIIEAPDMDAALKWAARCPAAQWGPIEVRPYMDGY